MTTESVAALLHLGAFALILGVGYLGLDRVHGEVDRLNKELTAIEAAVKQMLLRFGLYKDGNSHLNLRFECDEFRLLCYVGREKLHAPRGIAVRVWQKRVWVMPFLRSFHVKRDKKLVGVLVIIALYVFIRATAAAMWPEGWMISSATGFWFFAFFCIDIGITMFVAWCSSRLWSIKPRCEQFERDVLARYATLTEEMKNAMPAAENPTTAQNA
ncbi:MAG TPA: hypothetical protein VFC38_04695 [Stellaceae bacterium]|nr:hypothetical protein [Stellaceae bacterium]